MKIPEQVLLDKMHSTARGAQENLNNLWFNPNFDKRLSGVEYHIRFHRTTKSINQFNTLKCWELEIIFINMICSKENILL